LTQKKNDPYYESPFAKRLRELEKESKPYILNLKEDEGTVTLKRSSLPPKKPSMKSKVYETYGNPEPKRPTPAQVKEQNQTPVTGSTTTPHANPFKPSPMAQGNPDIAPYGQMVPYQGVQPYGGVDSYKGVQPYGQVTPYGQVVPYGQMVTADSEPDYIDAEIITENKPLMLGAAWDQQKLLGPAREDQKTGLTLPQSSNIQAAAYFEDKELLLVTFHSGSTYEYYEVSPDLVYSWEKAPSAGRFHYYNIRMSFEYHKL
jgi:hypothetical protein